MSFQSEGCGIANLAIEGTIEDLIKEQEKFIGASKKLKELGNLKGKISNKASTVKKEHKFFSKKYGMSYLHTKILMRGSG